MGCNWQLGSMNLCGVWGVYKDSIVAQIRVSNILVRAADEVWTLERQLAFYSMHQVIIYHTYAS